MLRKVLQSGIDYPQSYSFSRKLFQFVLPVILEGGNHLIVSQQLIQLTSVLDQYGLVQYCAKVPLRTEFPVFWEFLGIPTGVPCGTMWIVILENT